MKITICDKPAIIMGTILLASSVISISYGMQPERMLYFFAGMGFATIAAGFKISYKINPDSAIGKLITLKNRKKSERRKKE
jgi:hypothetical protein